AATDFDRGGETFTLTWTAPYSPNLLVENIVAYQNHSQEIVPSVEGVPNDCVVFGAVPADRFGILNQANCLDIETGRQSGTANESSADKRQRLTTRSQVTYFANNLWGMSHRFKFGLVVENERYFRRIERNPTLRFTTERVPLGSPPIVATVEARIAAPNGSQGRATGVNTTLFFEDQLRPIPSLTITAGFRYDREEINSDGFRPFDPEAEAATFLAPFDMTGPIPLDAFAIFTRFNDILDFRNEVGAVLGISPSFIPLSAAANVSSRLVKARQIEDINLVNHNVAPRISIAWDPGGDGKTKLTATAGRYYDKIFLAVPLVEIEPAETNITFRAFPQGDRFVNNGRVGSFDPAVSVQAIDHDLRTPYQNEFTLGFERALWNESSVRLTYIKRRFLDQLQDQDFNNAVDDRGRCVVPIFFGQRPVAASPGVGALITVPGTGEQYTDTDPGVGDGRIDDCTGDLLTSGTPLNPIQAEVPDGLPDLYNQNPAWGEILVIGNFNQTDYRALVLEFVRRQYRNWQMNFSYTYSRATGNAEDFDQLLGNERNLIEDEEGFLSFDQRHVAQLSAISLTPWGFRLGGTLRWESGLPFSDLQSKQTVFGRAPEYFNLASFNQKFRLRYTRNQRNDERNPGFWTVDMRLSKEFSPSAGTLLQVTVEVFNLLNDDTLRLEDRVRNTNAGSQRFGRQWQLGLRYSF
ncbi:MAG: TonB-dependent receptor, partial [Acidobacteriota bacterium]|nr:TonB-dependent receptor [Acidobacteriota bacterium]